VSDELSVYQPVYLTLTNFTSSQGASFIKIF
jgi:hypothetical protein